MTIIRPSMLLFFSNFILEKNNNIAALLKLKAFFESQLISREENEAKKAEVLTRI